MAVSCSNCGHAMNDDARFCSSCGNAVSAAPPPPPPPNYAAAYSTPSRLIRPRFGRMIAGVCQGLANAYAWDVVWVRVIAVLLAVFGGGIGLIAYFVFWVVMPEESIPMPQTTAWPPQAS